MLVLSIFLVCFFFKSLLLEKAWTLWMLLLLFLTVGILYQQLGEPEASQKMLASKKDAHLIQHFLKEVKTPEALLEKLRRLTENRPSNPKAWFLFGEMSLRYAYVNDAVKALEKAHDLKPNDTEIEIFYLQALFQKNGQQLDTKGKKIATKLYQKDSKQPDLLNMLAIDAKKQGASEKAQEYWGQLLQELPPNSPEYDFILGEIGALQT